MAYVQGNRLFVAKLTKKTKHFWERLKKRTERKRNPSNQHFVYEVCHFNCYFQLGLFLPFFQVAFLSLFSIDSRIFMHSARASEDLLLLLMMMRARVVQNLFGFWFYFRNISEFVQSSNIYAVKRAKDMAKKRLYTWLAVAATPTTATTYTSREAIAFSRNPMKIRNLKISVVYNWPNWTDKHRERKKEMERKLWRKHNIEHIRDSHFEWSLYLSLSIDRSVHLSVYRFVRGIGYEFGWCDTVIGQEWGDREYAWKMCIFRYTRDIKRAAMVKRKLEWIRGCVQCARGQSIEPHIKCSIETIHAKLDSSLLNVQRFLVRYENRWKIVCSLLWLFAFIPLWFPLCAHTFQNMNIIL